MKLIKYLLIISVILYANYSDSSDSDDIDSQRESSAMSNSGFDNFPGGNNYVYTNFSGEKFELCNHQYIDAKEGQEIVYRYNKGQLVIFTPVNPEDVIHVVDKNGSVLGTTYDNYGYTEEDNGQYVVRFKIVQAKKFGAGILVKKIN